MFAKQTCGLPSNRPLGQSTPVLQQMFIGKASFETRDYRVVFGLQTTKKRRFSLLFLIFL